MDRPRTFTHSSVLEGIAAGASWADQAMDPTEIDWDDRLKYAAIPFEIVNGRPVNPVESTGIRYGRNEMGHWGEALAADALVLATVNGRRHALMVERVDGHGWAIPGGHVDPGESELAAAVRELEEEASVKFTGACWEETAPRYVDDPRASDEAWMVTVLCVLDLGTLTVLPAVKGGDDAARAEWVYADSYAALTRDLAENYRGTVFRAHVDMLKGVF